MRAYFQPRYVEQDKTGLTEANVENSDWYHVSGTVVMVGGIQYILRIAKRFLKRRVGKRTHL
jgi:hypothetical protein